MSISSMPTKYKIEPPGGNMNYPRLWISLGFVWTAIITFCCLMPHVSVPVDISNFDKIEHFAAFAGLAGWFAAALQRRYLWVALGLSLLGAVIEVLQGYTGRDPSVWDWAADTIGVVAGLIVARPVGVPILRFIEDRVTPA